MKYTKILLLIIFAFLLFAPSASYAAEAKFTPQVSIGDFVKGEGETVEKRGRTIWNYIVAIYKYAIGVVGIVAAVVLMVGGIMWLTAGGNQTRIGEAKAYITASLTGLLLALTSFLILATVNPRLVEFNPMGVTKVGENKTTSSGSCEIINNESTCKVSSGCEWKDNKCIISTSGIKCGLSANEKDFTAKCCNKGVEYKYAKIPINQYCDDVCGTGWVNVDNTNCQNKLGY